MTSIVAEGGAANVVREMMDGTVKIRPATIPKDIEIRVSLFLIGALRVLAILLRASSPDDRDLLASSCGILFIIAV